MTKTYLRKYADGNIRHKMYHNNFTDWGKADGCDDFVIDLDQRTVTLVDPPKHGWVKDVSMWDYYDQGHFIGTVGPSLDFPNLWYIGAPNNRCYAISETAAKALFERLIK